MKPNPLADDSHDVSPVEYAADCEGVVAILTESQRGPAECTLYPADAEGEELMTTWMSAEEGSFVSLDEMC